MDTTQPPVSSGGHRAPNVRTLTDNGEHFPWNLTWQLKRVVHVCVCVCVKLCTKQTIKFWIWLKRNPLLSVSLSLRIIKDTTGFITFGNQTLNLTTQLTTFSFIVFKTNPQEFNSCYLLHLGAQRGSQHLCYCLTVCQWFLPVEKVWFCEIYCFHCAADAHDWRACWRHPMFSSGSKAPGYVLQ